MAKKHGDGVNLTGSVYAAARKRMLASLAKRLSELDAIYGQDAAKIRQALEPMLRIAGVPPKRVADAIDAVISGSRQARMDVIEGAIRDGAEHAQDIDAATFRALFVGEPETPPPKALRASASSREPTPLLRLVRGSGAKPPSTD